MSRRSSECRPPPPIIDCPLQKSQYQLLHLVGHGQYGQSEVHAAKCLTNGRTVAVKLIDLEKYSLDLDQLRKERAFWSTCQHPNVISYYGSFIDESILWCIMEYMDGGSIADILRFAFSKGFQDEIVIATILHELLQFLVYFHERRQIHRAICINNVLLTSQGEVKIGDLGSATELIRAGQRVRATFTVMDSSYSAPEVMIEGKGYGPAADIWSVGILTYIMSTGRDPFESLHPLAKVQTIISGPSPELPSSGYSSTLRDFIHQCLLRDPSKRPIASNLMKHSFIKKAKGPDFLRATIMSNLPPLSQRFDILNREDSNGSLVSPRSPQPLISFDFNLDEKGEEDSSHVPKLNASQQTTPKLSEQPPPKPSEQPPPKPSERRTSRPEVSGTVQGRFRVVRSPVSQSSSQKPPEQPSQKPPEPPVVKDYVQQVTAAVATAQDAAGDLEKNQDDLLEKLLQLEAAAKQMESDE